MLGYETARSSTDRRHRPALVIAIIGVHAAALIAVASARMDLPGPLAEVRTKIRWIPEAIKPPPPPPQQPRVQTPAPQPSTIDAPTPLIDPPIDRGPTIVPIPMPPVRIDPLPGPTIAPDPPVIPAAEVSRVGPRLLTRGDALRPPYPEAKRRMEEEAVLRLRLTVGSDGRVRAVEPVGRADPAFLESARRHLLARWRYAPATEGGAAVETTVTITLRFELANA